MDEERIDRILALARVPGGEPRPLSSYLDHYGVAEGELPAHVRKLLAEATREQDADGVEMALILLAVGDISAQLVPELEALAGHDWHRKHEDIAFDLGLARKRSSIAAIVAMANTDYPYLDYDEAKALGVKCTYALRNIGGEEAREALRSLESSLHAPIREAAKKNGARLDAGGGEASRREPSKAFTGRVEVLRHSHLVTGGTSKHFASEPHLRIQVLAIPPGRNGAELFPFHGELLLVCLQGKVWVRTERTGTRLFERDQLLLVDGAPFAIDSDSEEDALVQLVWTPGPNSCPECGQGMTPH